MPWMELIAFSTRDFFASRLGFRHRQHLAAVIGGCFFSSRLGRGRVGLVGTVNLAGFNHLFYEEILLELRGHFHNLIMNCASVNILVFVSSFIKTFCVAINKILIFILISFDTVFFEEADGL